jgi:hypothetical protein
MKNVFKNLDFTGSDYTLYRNKKKKSSSIIGGCLSILSYIIICIVTYFKIKEFVDNKIMNTFYSNYKIPAKEIERKYLSAKQDFKILKFFIWDPEMYKSHRFVLNFQFKRYILPKCDNDTSTFCLDIENIGVEIDRYLEYLTSSDISLMNCDQINQYNIEEGKGKEELDDCTGDWVDFTNKHKNGTINIEIDYNKYYYNTFAENFIKENFFHQVKIIEGEFALLNANTDIIEVDQIRKDLFFPIDEKKTVFTYLKIEEIFRERRGVN